MTCPSSEQDANSVSLTCSLTEPDMRKVPMVDMGHVVVALLDLGTDARCSLCVFQGTVLPHPCVSTMLGVC